MQSVGVVNSGLNNTSRHDDFPSEIEASLAIDHAQQADEKDDVRDVRKSVWGNELAAPKALQIFREIILGNYPELEDVKAPARAVWSDEAISTNPMRDAARMLGISWVGEKHEKDKSMPKKYYGQFATTAVQATEAESQGPRLVGPSSALLNVL